jgi:hypothetical protein
VDRGCDGISPVPGRSPPLASTSCGWMVAGSAALPDPVVALTAVPDPGARPFSTRPSRPGARATARGPVPPRGTSPGTVWCVPLSDRSRSVRACSTAPRCVETMPRGASRDPPAEGDGRGRQPMAVPTRSGSPPIAALRAPSRGPGPRGRRRRGRSPGRCRARPRTRGAAVVADDADAVPPQVHEAVGVRRRLSRRWSRALPAGAGRGVGPGGGGAEPPIATFPVSTVSRRPAVRPSRVGRPGVP